MEAAKSMRLWEIASELDAIGEELVLAGGEVTPELGERLDAMTGAFDDKAEKIALFIKECEVMAEGAALEEARLAAIKKHHTTKAKGLKDYLLFVMRRQGRTAIRTPRVRVWEQANGRPSIRFVGDMSTLPAAFIRTKTETSVDTQFAYVEHQAGAELPEGFVVDYASHLRIS